MWPCRGLAAAGWIAAVAEDGIGEGDGIFVDARFAHLLDGAIDVVWDASEFYLTIFDDCISSAGITVAWLSDAAGIDDLHAFEFEVHGNVGVADADEVGVDVFESLVPEVGLWFEVFVHGIAWGGVDHQEP